MSDSLARSDEVGLLVGTPAQPERAEAKELQTWRERYLPAIAEGGGRVTRNRSASDPGVTQTGTRLNPKNAETDLSL